MELIRTNKTTETRFLIKVSSAIRESLLDFLLKVLLNWPLSNELSKKEKLKSEAQYIDLRFIEFYGTHLLIPFCAARDLKENTRTYPYRKLVQQYNATVNKSLVNKSLDLVDSQIYRKMVTINSAEKAPMDLDETHADDSDNDSGEEEEESEREVSDKQATDMDNKTEYQEPSAPQQSDILDDTIPPPLPKKGPPSPTTSSQEAPNQIKVDLNKVSSFKISEISKVKLVTYSKKQTIRAWLTMCKSMLTRMGITGDANRINIIILHLPSDSIPEIEKLFSSLPPGEQLFENFESILLKHFSMDPDVAERKLLNYKFQNPSSIKEFFDDIKSLTVESNPNSSEDVIKSLAYSYFKQKLPRALRNSEMFILNSNQSITYQLEKLEKLYNNLPKENINKVSTAKAKPEEIKQKKDEEVKTQNINSMNTRGRGRGNSFNKRGKPQNQQHRGTDNYRGNSMRGNSRGRSNFYQRGQNSRNYNGRGNFNNSRGNYKTPYNTDNSPRYADATDNKPSYNYTIQNYNHYQQKQNYRQDRPDFRNMQCQSCSQYGHASQAYYKCPNYSK